MRHGRYALFSGNVTLVGETDPLMPDVHARVDQTNLRVSM